MLYHWKCDKLYAMIHIDHKYIRLLSSQLDQFKQKSEELYNFRCPVCGDSEKNTYKARGYAFRKSNSLIFKCHNCGDSRSLGKLIEHVDHSMYRQYVMERYKSGNTPKSSIPKSDFKFEAPVFAKQSPGRLLSDIGAFRLATLPDDHIANQFVNNRKLPKDKTSKLYYIDDEERLEFLSNKYKDRIAGHTPRLIIPFCDLDGNMIGLTGRALSDKGLRYLALKFNAEHEPLIYGLNEVDDGRHCYVVEGPLDSLFLDNAIAVGGADFSKLDGYVRKQSSTLVFDNEPRNKEIVARMYKMIEAGWTICVWPEKIAQKDINDMILAGMNPDEISQTINRNKFSGLSAKFRVNEWKKC